MTEFSHLVAHDAIGRSGPLALTANAAERAAITARLGLEAAERFEVAAVLEATAEGARLTGAVTADVVQSCAATGLPVPAQVRAPFTLRYVAALDLPGEPEAEVELGDEDLDIMPLEPGGVDVGEAAVQTLALALDPFPRHPDAERILKERGVLSEGQAGPFAALAALKKP
ncbi:MAG: DUF177 domain-containing protein [Sphingopyxis sp.]|nr:DUF177 domain-containing protein [Sphingopyxis sp.]